MTETKLGVKVEGADFSDFSLAIGILEREVNCKLGAFEELTGRLSRLITFNWGDTWEIGVG